MEALAAHAEDSGLARDRSLATFRATEVTTTHATGAPGPGFTKVDGRKLVPEGRPTDLVPRTRIDGALALPTRGPAPMHLTPKDVQARILHE